MVSIVTFMKPIKNIKNQSKTQKYKKTLAAFRFYGHHISSPKTWFFVATVLCDGVRLWPIGISTYSNLEGFPVLSHRNLDVCTHTYLTHCFILAIALCISIYSDLDCNL